MYGEYEKQPSLCDVGLECEVLTVALEYPEKMYELNEFFKPAHFHDEAYGKVWHALQEAHKAGEPADFALLQRRLDSAGASVDLESLALELQASTVTKDTLVHYALKLEDLALRRQALAYLQESAPKLSAVDKDAETLIVEIQAGMHQLSKEKFEKHLHEFRDLLARERANWLKRRMGKEPNKGVMSGYKTLDDLTLGFRSGELTLIAGNTAHGKTTLGINILAHMLLEERKRIAVFSIEMLADRMFSRMVRSLFEKAVVTKDGEDMTDEQWAIVDKTLGELEKEDFPLFIDDTPSIHIDHMRSKMLYMVKQYHVDLVFVDYTQLIMGDGGNRQEEVAAVVQGLRAMAKEFGIAVVALAQFNRADSREQWLRMPKAHNMRESGTLETTADVVLSIMRPEITLEAESIGGVKLAGRAILSVLKNREGKTLHIDMLFDGDRTKFVELPQGQPSLVQAVLRTGGRPDINGTASGGASAGAYGSASTGSTGYASGHASAQKPVNEQEPLPAIKKGGYLEDDMMV